jgi:hypothetical protein
MTIIKRGSGFRVVSEKGKNLGDEPSKDAAVKRLKQVEWFKHHGKCIVDPELVKGNEGMQQYVPVVFQVHKPQDKEAKKLDFPSTTKQLELRDVKQPEFPSTPFKGEAYAQAFHNPRPSNETKDGTHVIVQGDTPAEQGWGPFKGEHGPDIQFKGSDYVPDSVKKKARAANAKKSVMIAGKRVIIKSSEGSDNIHFQNYPQDRGADPRPFDQNEERQKRDDFLNEQKTKDKMKAYEEAKRNSAPGNGPYGLAQGPDAYLGRSMNKGYGKFFDDKDSMKILSDKEIKAKQKADKEIKAPKKVTREIKIIKKAKGIMKLILQYTQNQPLAAGFKPLLAHLVKDDENNEENLKGTKIAEANKAMSTGDIAEKIRSTSKPSTGASSASRVRLMSRAAQEKTDNSSDDDVGPHPDFGVHGGYKGDTSKLGKAYDYLTRKKEALRNEGSGDNKPPKQHVPDEKYDYLARKKEAIKEEGNMGKGAFKDKWIKQQEAKGKNPSALPKEKKEKPNYKDPTTRMLMTDGLFKPAGSTKKSHPNPIKGGIGDKLDYKDVDQNELAEGINIEQEHVKNSDDDEDKKRVKAADIAMDHLEEDEKYYTHLDEMERKAKEEKKNETKKKKLLRVVDKSFVFRKGMFNFSHDDERTSDSWEGNKVKPLGEQNPSRGTIKPFREESRSPGKIKPFREEKRPSGKIKPFKKD